MYVEGRVLDIHGKPVPNASIETWEADSKGAALYGILRPSRVSDDGGKGFYDVQYQDRTIPDCRGRLRSDDQGRYGYRAVLPVAYVIPEDVRRSHFDFGQRF